MDELETIQAIDDPLECARQAHTAIESHQQQVSRLSAVRRDALNRLAERGMSPTEIAKELGISRSRVSQLRSAGLKAERAFFGTGRLTVAIGSKTELGRRDSVEKLVVSKEAVAAFDLIADTARTLGLDVAREVVPQGGLVDLNRENLVVLCAVRLLPFLSQVLAADSHLDFLEDEKGWYLKDHTTDTEYRSPRDSGELRDYGYVGRLPSPSGRGTFLYAAGIHSEGTLGAATWLTENATELYRNIKLGRFSTLVETKFDETSTITDVRQMTALYRENS